MEDFAKNSLAHKTQVSRLRKPYGLFIFYTLEYEHEKSMTLPQYAVSVKPFHLNVDKIIGTTYVS